MIARTGQQGDWVDMGAFSIFVLVVVILAVIIILMGVKSVADLTADRLRWR